MNYYCQMREQLLTALGKQITLDDGVKYQYAISQVEVENALGAVVAVLDQLIITDEAGNLYKLYKTKEGNWYDLDAENNTFQQAVLQRLKRAIDSSLKEVSE